MNFFLAYLLFSVGHIIGTPTIIGEETPLDRVQSITVQIVEAAEGSPAALAGLKAGDVIEDFSFNGERFSATTGDAVQTFILGHAGEEIIFHILRNKEQKDFNILVRVSAPEGEGLTGIEFVETGLVRYPPPIALVEGAKTTGILTYKTIEAFGQTIVSAVSQRKIPETLSGPVGIAVMTGAVRDLGFVYIIQFIALISLSLGTLNIIPFPALDGGRLLFLVIEKLKGSAVSRKVEGYAHAAGFAFLILLIVVITYKDITRFF